MFPLLLALLMPQNSPTLESLRDNHRALLVFAPSDQAPLYKQQVAILRAHTAEMNDRDLIAVPVLGQANEQLELRRRFHIAPSNFTVILIGKDGGEKLRRHIPISVEDLERNIDAMPMRRDEMRRKSQP